MRVLAILPARYASTRLPGKPLLDLCGKPMIQRVYEAVQKASCVTDIVVATDDERIVQAVNAFGGRACLTSPDCASGTDRLVEIARTEQADIYLNVQGDEPLVEPSSIEKLAQAMVDEPSLQMGTLCYPVSVEQAQNPNLVKVVRAHNGNALYFSRSPIPFPRSGGIEPSYFGHLGIYAYRRDFLLNFGSLPYSPLENTEKLEQLRVLEAGIAIRVLEVKAMGPGVDTPEDLEEVRRIVAAQAGK